MRRPNNCLRYSPSICKVPADRARVVRTAADSLQQLAVSGLTYHYPPSATAGIHEINFQLTTGTLTVITGEIGAGKTTLLCVLLGLLPKDGGEIRWNGTPVADPAGFFVPPRVAYTPQTPRLFSEKSRDNIVGHTPERGKDVKPHSNKRFR